MDATWQVVLAGALVATGILGLGYRLYRWRKKGPIGDVWGQGVLAVVLAGVAAAVIRDVTWARVVAVGFGGAFAIVVMPLWVLAVLIPLRPGRVDIAFTAIYWVLLLVIVAAGIAA